MSIKKLLPLLVLLALAFGSARTALAQPPDNEPIDVILIIDDSGSMSDRWASGTRRPNDPQGLRHSAARLFIDLARQGDRVGVMSFHTNPTALGELADGKLTTITGLDSKEALKATIVQPTTPAPEERLTDMRKALQLANEIVDANEVGNRQFIVFLTDGRPYPPDQRKELLAAIRQLADKDVTMFPILLGKDVDLDIAETMANRSGGLVQQVARPGDLLQAYAQIYGFIQPERYVDEVNLTDGRLASFRTRPDQGITNLSILLPKATDANSGVAALSRNGEDVLKLDTLPDGASLRRSGDEHYEVVSLSNNTPLVGDWSAMATSADQVGASKALVIADSVASLILESPYTEDASNSASPRYYPAGKPALLAVRVEQDGSRVTGLDMQALADGILHPLESGGLSGDGSLYWTTLSLEGSEDAGASTEVGIQIGEELAPVRLQKTFSLISGNFPKLIADSPLDRATGLVDDGRMRLKAHFEGDTLPDSRSVVAYVSDRNTGDVTAVTLACDAAGVCEDRSFTPEQGTAYDVLFLANASVDGVAYSDFASGGLTMRDALRMDSLPPILDFGRVPPYEESVSRDLVISAFTNQDIELDATLALRGADGDIPANALALTLSHPEVRDDRRYISVLQLSGFDSLEPGEYSGRINFSSPVDLDLEPPSVAIQFTIPTPEVELVLPDSPYLGDLARPGEPAEFNVEAEFTGGEPSNIEARLMELSSGGRAVDTGDFQVSVGAPKPVQEGSRQFIIPVQLAAAKRPTPGTYQGEILFSSSDGLTVDPQRMQVTFNVPQPVTTIEVEGDRIDFGASANLSQPISTTVLLVQSILDQPPPLTVSLEDLSHSEGLVNGEAPQLTVSTGAVRTTPDGAFRLPVYVSAVGDAAPGLYQGTLRFATSEDVLIQPAAVDFVVQQYTTLQAWQQRLKPIASFFYTWFIPLPLIRFQGFLGWLALLILINTILRIRPASTTEAGIISSDESGQIVKLKGQNPLFLVADGAGVQISQKKKDRSRALAIINLEQQLDKRSEQLVWRPVVRPSPIAPEPVKISYWRQRNRRWYLVREEGASLWHGARFRLRLPSTDARYHFRYVAQ